MLFKVNEILELLYLLLNNKSSDSGRHETHIVLLHDNLVLDITAITLPFFFVEGVTGTQMLALSVVRTVCLVSKVTICRFSLVIPSIEN